MTRSVDPAHEPHRRRPRPVAWLMLCWALSACGDSPASEVAHGPLPLAAPQGPEDRAADSRAPKPSGRDAPAAASAPADPVAKATPPQREIRPGAPRRIIFVSIDTLAANHLSTYGYGRLTTPALSELAREAVVFDNAIAPAPWTYPSYASQLTSRHSTAIMERGMRVPESQVLLAEYMRSAGYLTAGFVDNEYLHPMHGFRQGFHYYRALANSSGRSLREALDWVDKHPGRPSFVFAHTNDVHGPYRPRAPFTELFDHGPLRGKPHLLPILPTTQAHVFGALPRYQVLGKEQDIEFYRARYDAAIRQTDLWFEKLLHRLRAFPDWDETVVIFSADHGESFGGHDFFLNHGLVYEDVIRVPLVIRLPHGEQGGTRIRQQVSLLDLLPTLLELTGEPLQKPIAGSSLLPLIRGQVNEQSRYVFASQGIFEQFTVRTDRYKLIRMQPGTASQDYAWRTFPRTPRPGPDEVIYQLFDLQNDPDEEHDLARRMPQKVAELREVLEGWIQEKPDFDNESFDLSDEHKDRLRQLGYVQ